MDEHDWLAEQFEANRAHLQAVAHRMLGSLSEADDAVQESWLHLSRSDTSGVLNLGGWLTTVVARICLEMLRSRNSRREESLDASVSEPVTAREGGIDPEHEAELSDSVGLALLVVLDTLSPAERLAFVLHDVLAVLDPDVVFRADRTAVSAGASREVRGAASVARQFSGRAQGARPALVNGAVGLVVARHGRLFLVLGLTIRHGKIVGIDAVADPARLRQLRLSVLGSS